MCSETKQIMNQYFFLQLLLLPWFFSFINGHKVENLTSKIQQDQYTFPLFLHIQAFLTKHSIHCSRMFLLCMRVLCFLHDHGVPIELFFYLGPHFKKLSYYLHAPPSMYCISSEAEDCCVSTSERGCTLDQNKLKCMGWCGPSLRLMNSMEQNLSSEIYNHLATQDISPCFLESEDSFLCM